MNTSEEIDSASNGPAIVFERRRPRKWRACQLRFIWWSIRHWLNQQMMIVMIVNLTDGDIAILRFVAAAELIEADLWTQYAELGGVTGGTQNPYQLALQNLDGDGSQYITSNTLDEVSHAAFLNAYLESKGAEPVELGCLPQPPGQPRNRRAEHRPPDQSHASQRRYQFLYPVSQHHESGLRCHIPASHQHHQPHGHSPNRCRHERSAPYPGHRKYRGISLRRHRAGRLQLVCQSLAQGHQ